MKGHRFDPSVLREYDIRGVVGKTLSSDDATAVGRAFGTIMRRSGYKCVAVAYDGRLSSPEIADALGAGLSACGLHVVRCGRGPTPMLYYATQAEDVDAGVMVTGSHNPPDYNGFKLVLEGKPFFGERIQQLGELAAAGDFEAGEGSFEDRSPQSDYVARLISDYEGERPLSVAWDAGNGAAAEVMVALTRGLPGKHLLLNETIDGTFPAHHPDPTVAENLRQLSEAVVREGCDLGIAFDGDGDRIGVVDGEGQILWGDQIMVLFARDVLQAHRGAPVIADVKASQVLSDEIARAGGRPIMWRTGHAPIKAKMAAEAAPLAGEMSAHIFFADRYYGYDDALYAAVRLLGIVSRSDQSLVEFRQSLTPVLNTPEIRFPCPEDRKFAVVEEVKNRLAESGAEVIDIDGVRVRNDDGWWLLRASNTQDVLVVRCEARTEAGLARLKALVNEQLAASGVETPAL